MTAKQVFDILSNVSALSILLPLLCGVFSFKTLDKSLRVLFLYTIVSAFAELLFYIYFIKSKPDYVIRNSFALVQFSLIMWFYYLNGNTKLWKKVLTGGIVFYFFVFTYLIVRSGEFGHKSGVLKPLEASIILMIGAIFLVKNVLDDEVYLKLNSFPFIWANYGFMVYFGINLFLFFFDSNLDTMALRNFYIFYGVHLVINIVFNILISKSIWIAKQK